jgi:hypothetical protein
LGLVREMFKLQALRVRASNTTRQMELGNRLTRMMRIILELF